MKTSRKLRGKKAGETSSTQRSPKHRQWEAFLATAENLPSPDLVKNLGTLPLPYRRIIE